MDRRLSARLTTEQTEDASGVSVTFDVDGKAVNAVGVIGMSIIVGLVTLTPLLGLPNTATFLLAGASGVCLFLGFVVAMLPVIVLGSTRRRIRVTTRSVTVVTIFTGVPKNRRTYPFETLRSVHVERRGRRSYLVLTDDDSSIGWRLGSHADVVAVAEWLNELLARTDQLEAHPDELVPADLAHLSTSATRET